MAALAPKFNGRHRRVDTYSRADVAALRSRTGALNQAITSWLLGIVLVVIGAVLKTCLSHSTEVHKPCGEERSQPAASLSEPR